MKTCKDVLTDTRTFPYHPPFLGDQGVWVSTGTGKTGLHTSVVELPPVYAIGRQQLELQQLRSFQRKPETFPYPAVSLQGLHKGIVCFCIKIQPLVHVLQEVQVLKRGVGLLPLFSGCSSLVRGAFQVIGQVHPHGPRQDIVHHHDADVDASRLHAVQPVEFWQKSPWILV